MLRHFLLYNSCLDELLDRCIDFSQTCADDEDSDNETDDDVVKTEPGLKIICPDIKTDSETETETDDDSKSEVDFVIAFDQPPIVRKLGDPHL